MITEEQLAKDREPIPYIPVKQLRRDRPLYVMKQTRPHPIRGYGNSHDEFSVVDIRGYRKGYEPRLDILGQYTPNSHDLFRLETGRLPPYQPTATGDKLQAEMERLQVHKAWRINPIARGNPMTPEEVPAVPEVTTRLRDGVELEGRIFGGSYDISRLRFADRTAAIRKDIPNAQRRYNEIRVAQGLEPVTDWTNRPSETLEQMLRAELAKPPAVEVPAVPEVVTPEEQLKEILEDIGHLTRAAKEGIAPGQFATLAEMEFRIAKEKEFITEGDFDNAASEIARIDDLIVEGKPDEAIKRLGELRRTAETLLRRPPAVGGNPIPEEVPAVPEVKEPWQMTRAEYRASQYESAKASAIDQTPRAHWGDEEWLQRSIEWRLDMLADAHKTYIRKMLAEGKPVPPEVLKDYPDLAKKHSNPEAVEKGQILNIENPKPWNEDLEGKRVEVYEVRPDGRIAAHFVDKADIKRWSAKMFIFDRTELLPKPPAATEETIDLTKGRMIEIPLDANGKAIPIESEGDNPGTYTSLQLFDPSMKEKIITAWQKNRVVFWKYGTIRPHFNDIAVCLKERKVRNLISGKEIAEYLAKSKLGGSNPDLLPENVPEEDFTTVTDVDSIYDLFSEGKISLRELDRLKDHYYKWYYSPERRTTVLRFYRQPDGTMTIYKQVYVQTYGESGNPGGGALTSKIAKVMEYRRLHPEYIPSDLTEQEFTVLEKVFTAVITATDFELSVKEAMLLWATADRGYVELKSPNPNTTVGTCYEDAWRFQIKQEEGILVHGEITGADGITRKHAWVELETGFIYEPQTARFFKADVFKRTFNPKEDARYTVEEAAKQAARRGYHGAWAEEVPAVPEVARVTGKARLVPNLLSIAEESTNELVATLNDLPADVRGTFDGMLRFLDEYAQLATRGEAYSDASVNTLYEIISGYRDDIGLAFGRPNEVFIERFNEAEANPTRANKVIALDAFVSLIHERGAAIPVIFGKGLKRATGRGIGSVRERIFQDVTENVNDILDDLAKPPAVEQVKEGSNPMGKLITKEEAIGLLERLSMTPGEAARSLVADEAERREIIQTVQQRVKREQNKWAPMDPREGPPLPRIFAGLRWPWKK